ncbi:terminase [Flagellimonas lutimaris]|uniref:terminase n=1 Tax=Flagellimonas lutimaris TaxID=475082 RepID=UPI003F5CF60E
MGAPKNNNYAFGNPGGGRNSSFKPEYADTAYKLCLLGATDKEMANFFNVSETTINNWKKNHQEFSLAQRKGKMVADAEVAERLYQRAVGYEYEERREQLDPNTKKLVKITTIKKHVVPDVSAQLTWLKNRQPNKWRDSKNIDHTARGEKIEYSREELMDEMKRILSGDDEE